MAGAGYKLFNTGDVLTAAQVNTYLQEQVVMVFANAAARTTALSGVLAEGMVSYLKDTNATEVYDGSAWVGIGNSGDITGITTGATSGLTGGVTSGTADLKFNTTAKGGLLVGTGSGTVSELAVGSNTQVLTADSTTATGLKWAAASSGGFGTFTSYTPTYTNFTLGNGSVSAQYATSGALVWYQGQIVLGSTSSVSGNLAISLPYNVITTFDDSTFHPFSGTASAYDNSAATFQSARPGSGNGANLQFTNLSATTTWSTTVPWTWATSDRINWQVIYRSSAL